MPTLVIKSPDGTEQEQDFVDQLTVGRAEGNDLILAEGGVSRKHARFFLDGEHVMVEDLGSANGTIVNGERIDGPTKLEPSAAILLGDYEATLKTGNKARPKVDKGAAKPSSRGTQAIKRPANLARAEGGRSTKVVPVVKPPAASAGAKRPSRAGSAGPALRGLSGTVTGKSFPLSGTVVVGRVAGVDLRVDDDSVSRRHAELEVQGGEVVLRDLGSANGTTVNGNPISEDTPLSPGDIIQFGVVELMYENGAASGAKPAVRPARGAGGRPSRRGGADDEPIESMATATSPMDPKKKRLFIIGGAVLGVLFVAVLVKGLSDDTPSGPKPNQPNIGVPAKPPPDPAEEIEELLKVCRTYSSCEGRVADWGKAEAACAKILDIEPIHGPANELMKRIKYERSAEEGFLKGKELAASGRLEEALDSFAKVRPFSKEVVGCFFLDTLSAAKPVIDEVKKAVGGECKTYSANAKWDNALKRCEVYMRLACQTMTQDELEPPYPLKMKLDGPLGKNDWRPKDPNYVNFLKAREKLRPGDAPWKCPDIPVFRPPAPPPDPGKLALKEFKDRYKEEAMGRALVLYYQGAFAEAPVPIQKVIENVNKAALHDEARALLLDVTNAISYFKTGQTELSNDKPEKAEEPFRKALALDEKLVLGDKLKTLKEDEKRRELEKRSSFVRKGIVEGMSGTCYVKGKTQADKKDFRAACKVWKLGLSFSRANADLLKAGYFCTQRAKEALDKAMASGSCEQLKAVLDLAVDGDGYKEQVQEIIDQNCK